MRAWPVILILALAGGVGYLFLVKPAWFVQLLGQGEEVLEKAKGYPYASEPKQAMELFRKAVKERNYKIAAKYCTGKYSKELENANDAAHAIGDLVDRIMGYMKEKGLNKDSTVKVLQQLDPFPVDFEIKSFPEKNKDGKYYGSFEMKITNATTAMVELNDVDLKMFQQVLKPRWTGVVGAFEVVSEDHDGDKIWKIRIDLAPAVGVMPSQELLIDHFVNNYKRYETGLERFRDEMLNNRYPDTQAFQDELFSVLRKAKE